MPLLSTSQDEGWHRSSPSIIRFKFEGSSGGELELVATREEEDMMVIRGTISVRMWMLEFGMSRWVSRERKWFLPVGDEDDAKVSDEGEDHVNLEAKGLEEDRNLESLEHQGEERWWRNCTIISLMPN